MSLGNMNGVSLKEARELRDIYQAFAVRGIDPRVERDKQTTKRAADLVTVNDVAIETFGATKKSLVKDGKAGRWYSPLKLHILPELEHRPIIQIDQNDIRETLEPDLAHKTRHRQKSYELTEHGF